MGGISNMYITLHSMLKMLFSQNYNNSRDKLDLKNIMPVN